MFACPFAHKWGAGVQEGERRADPLAELPVWAVIRVNGKGVLSLHCRALVLGVSCLRADKVEGVNTEGVPTFHTPVARWGPKTEGANGGVWTRGMCTRMGGGGSTNC